MRGDCLPSKEGRWKGKRKRGNPYVNQRRQDTKNQDELIFYQTLQVSRKPRGQGQRADSNTGKRRSREHRGGIAFEKRSIESSLAEAKTRCLDSTGVTRFRTQEENR